MSASASPGHRDNSFDALRLFLALVVVYSHSYAVGGFGNEWTLHYIKGQTTGGSVAVLGFFGISGYLVTKSFCHRPEWRIFIKRRLLRILPGFYFSLLVVAFILAPLIFLFKGDPQSSWSWKEALEFIRKNSLVSIEKWNLGSALIGLPYPGGINGSLWSLFPELCCYGLVLALGILGLLRKGPELVVLGGFLLFLNVALILNPTIALPVLPTLAFSSMNLPFYISFIVGAALYLWSDRLDFGRAGAVFWVLGCLFILRCGGWWILGPVIFPFAMIHCAHSFSLRLPIDLSYGIYLFHFPCFQLAAALHLHQRGYLPFLVFGAVTTLLLALVSWFFIEKPAMTFKEKHKQQSTPSLSPVMKSAKV